MNAQIITGVITPRTVNSSLLFPMCSLCSMPLRMSRWIMLRPITDEIARMPPFAHEVAAPRTPEHMKRPIHAGTS